MEKESLEYINKLPKSLKEVEMLYQNLINGKGGILMSDKSRDVLIRLTKSFTSNNDISQREYTSCKESLRKCSRIFLEENIASVSSLISRPSSYKEKLFNDVGDLNNKNVVDLLSSIYNYSLSESKKNISEILDGEEDNSIIDNIKLLEDLKKRILDEKLNNSIVLDVDKKLVEKHEDILYCPEVINVLAYARREILNNTIEALNKKLICKHSILKRAIKDVVYNGKVEVDLYGRK